MPAGFEWLWFSLAQLGMSVPSTIKKLDICQPHIYKLGYKLKEHHTRRCSPIQQHLCRVESTHICCKNSNITSFTKAGGVKVCHPTWSFDMTHGGGCMSGSPPLFITHPPILKPNGPCGPLPAQLGSLPDISESFPALGSGSAPLTAAAAAR